MLYRDFASYIFKILFFFVYKFTVCVIYEDCNWKVYIYK